MSDGGSGGQKRKSMQRACVDCRRRKKRCLHATQSLPDQDISSDLDQSVDSLPEHEVAPIANEDASRVFDHALSAKASVTSRNESPSTIHQELCHEATGVPGTSLRPVNDSICTVSDTQSGTGETRTNVPHDQEDQFPQFTGDLDPQVRLPSVTNPGDNNASSARNSIGVWLAGKLGGDSSLPNTASPPGSIRSTLFEGSSPLLRDVVVPLLEEECLAELPAAADVEKLASIYFDHMHPVFPIINESAFRSIPTNEPACILIRQAVCLMASMNRVAIPYLRLPRATSILPQREFGSRIYAAMRIIVDFGLVKSPVVLTQAMALMSLFVEGKEGKIKSTHLSAAAVQYAYSLGLHQHDRPSSRQQYGTTLLCCIWALDRLNAAFHGRPVLMHERDFGVQLDVCLKEQQPCFQLFLRVVLLLDKVIDLYRPNTAHSMTGWDQDFPAFESLISESDAFHVQAPLIASIETLYHAIAMLSRRSRSWDTTARSSSAFVRQSYSALRVPSIVGEEFRHTLPWFPFVTYAVSLSLSVAYCEMRQSDIPLYRTRAQTQFRNTCNVLRELGDVFWSASTAADIGEAVLGELQKSSLNSNGNGGSAVFMDGHSQMPQQQSLAGDLGPSRPWKSQSSNTSHSNMNDPTPHDFPIYPSGNIQAPFDDMFGYLDPSLDFGGIDSYLEGKLELYLPTDFP